MAFEQVVVVVTAGSWEFFNRLQRFGTFMKRLIAVVKEAMRTHILVPRDLVAAVDRIAGRRKRSEFLTEALREKLTRALQKEALDKTVGALAASDHPEWETPEKTSAWVHDLRAAADRHSQEKLRDSRV